MRNVPGTAPMITTIGLSYILINIILLGVGAEHEELRQPAAEAELAHRRGGPCDLREVLVWIVASC